MDYLFIQNNLDPFDTFLSLTNNAPKQLKYLNDDESYSYLYNQLKTKVNTKQLLNNIKLDYLLKNKMKPKIWWDYSLSKEDRNKYFDIFNKQYSIDSITFHNYSYIDTINNEIILFVYKDNKVTVYKTKELQS